VESRGDLQERGRPTAGDVQGLTAGAVACGLVPCHGQEGRPVIGVGLERVAGGFVATHFAHT